MLLLRRTQVYRRTPQVSDGEESDNRCSTPNLQSYPLKHTQFAREKQSSAFLISIRKPDTAPQVTLETLFEFTENTKLEYAYQMLLLLVMLQWADEDGEFSLDEAAYCFSEFYRLRRGAGLPAEKSYGLKHAVVDNPHASQSQLRQMLKTSPFPRFERQGLLDLSEDDRYFVVNPALLEALTPMVRESLRRKAVGRLAEHFGEEERVIEEMVVRAVG
jgi:hypothetical protein